jgi:archaeal flagellin FlaB
MQGGKPNDSAFTGLEAAIIFIAFVVVAAVFSSVVLNMGMFTAQKSQEVVKSGLDEAGGAFRLGGTIIGKWDNPDDRLRYLYLDLEMATDLSAIDMAGMTYTIVTKDRLITLSPGDPRIKQLAWRLRNDADTLLEAGELVTVQLEVKDFNIRAGETFSIEMASSEGAALTVTRTIPPSVEKNASFELF